MLGDAPLDHQSQGGFSTAFFTEDHRGRRVVWLAINLLKVGVGRLVIRQPQENSVVAGLLGPEWIFAHLPMVPERLDTHGPDYRVVCHRRGGFAAQRQSNPNSLGIQA